MKQMKIFMVGLLLSGGILIMCNDSSISTTPFKFHKSFWMHTELTNAKDYFIQISLPQDYYDSDERKYPVLYLTDADLCFNMAQDLTLVLDWPQRKIIVVGIGYGSPAKLMELRRGEYNNTPDEKGLVGAHRLLKFIEEELIPKVESEFRINPNNKTLLGWSWGSLFATSVLEQNPRLFQNYILGGGYRESGYVDNLYEKYPDLPVNIYLGIGEYDEMNVNQLFQNYVKAFESKGFGGLEFYWEVFPKKDHEIITIADLIDRGMKWIYSRKPITPRLDLALKSGKAGAVLDEYNKLLKSNPDDFDFSPHSLITFAESLGDDNGIKREIMEFVNRKYPLRKVTINVIPKEMPPYDSVYITGNQPEIGNWNPKLVKMEKGKNGVWTSTYFLRVMDNLEFKITRGSWDTQAADSMGSMLQNFQEYFESDTVISIVIDKWIDLK